LPMYKYSWFRDNSWIAYAMLIVNEIESAERFHDWASDTIIRYKKRIIRAIEKGKEKKLLGDDFIHARYTIYGKGVRIKWNNLQHDGLGVWLWSLANYIKLTGKSKKRWIKATGLICDYLSVLWKMPCSDLWEENPGKLHTSTLASIYGGLLSFSEILPKKGLKNTCKDIKEFILRNNIYENKLVKYIGSKEVDSSLIICSVPFNLFKVNGYIIKNTISKIVKDLRVTNGLRRYKCDTYYGGGEWIILACWLGWYYLLLNKRNYAINILKWVEDKKDENNYLPEQINHVDDKMYNKWIRKWGNPANPLLWSHAMYIILHSMIKKN